MRNPIQSFKKVINIAPASVAAATQTNAQAVIGVDSVAAGQTTVIDAQVPTGSIIKQIEFQLSMANLVSVASFVHVAIYHRHSGQGFPGANTIGGDPQRNQIHWQRLYSLGKDQNRDIVKKFKVPKKFQRVREADEWRLLVTCDTIRTEAYQFIYKFYR